MKKNVTRYLSLFLVLLLLASTLMACDKGRTEKPDDNVGEKLKVALVLPGKKDDVSFNQAMYEGVTRYYEAHKDEMDLTVVENVYEVADIEPALSDFADEDYDVIFGHGFQFMEPLVAVADRYPDSYFLLGTGYMFRENSAIYDVALGSGGYLMGVVAALATQTDKIGVIGGVDASEMVRGHNGFRQGALSINPDIEIQEVYTGDWTDTAGAFEAANGMYDSGVDVIWHSGDGIGMGVVQAAVEKDKYVLGNVADQLPLGPNNVLTGCEYHWEAVIEQIFADIADGSFKNLKDDERIYWISIANDGLKYTKINDPKGYLTDEDIAKIEDVFKQLKNEEIVFEGE
jgi:basic membrane protein A